MLDTYTDFLLCSFGQASAANLSRLSDGQISPDRVTRFLNAECQNSAALWRYVKPLVRQVEQDDGVLIIDDSIAKKPIPMKATLSVGIGTPAKSVIAKASTS